MGHVKYDILLQNFRSVSDLPLCHLETLGQQFQNIGLYTVQASGLRLASSFRYTSRTIEVHPCLPRVQLFDCNLRATSLVPPDHDLLFRFFDPGYVSSTSSRFTSPSYTLAYFRLRWRFSISYREVHPVSLLNMLQSWVYLYIFDRKRGVQSPAMKTWNCLISSSASYITFRTNSLKRWQKNPTNLFLSLVTMDWFVLQFSPLTSISFSLDLSNFCSM